MAPRPEADKGSTMLEKHRERLERVRLCAGGRRGRFELATACLPAAPRQLVFQAQSCAHAEDVLACNPRVACIPSPPPQARREIATRKLHALVPEIGKLARAMALEETNFNADEALELLRKFQARHPDQLAQLLQRRADFLQRREAERGGGAGACGGCDTCRSRPDMVSHDVFWGPVRLVRRAGPALGLTACYLEARAPRQTSSQIPLLLMQVPPAPIRTTARGGAGAAASTGGTGL